MFTSWPAVAHIKLFSPSLPRVLEIVLLQLLLLPVSSIKNKITPVQLANLAMETKTGVVLGCKNLFLF